MHIEEKDFLPIIFGSDINTYGMARAFYEEYQIKSIVIGKYPSGPSCNSKIIDYYSDLNIGMTTVFLKWVDSFSEKFAAKKILLIGCGDNYVELIVQNRDLFRKNVIVPYLEESLLKSLLTKQKFYEMCEQCGLDYPKTVICDGRAAENFVFPFSYPAIIKPSNSVSYWKHEFAGQKKVYRVFDDGEARQIVAAIYKAGYDDSLIIQEYIAGDDSFLRVMVTYSGQDKKVKLMSLAHVMLEEYTPQGLGSTSVLITAYDEELSGKIKTFLDEIGYVGFATFDIKFDHRDEKFKMLEINCRQGRSSYYVTAAGSNLAKYVADEYIYQKTWDFYVTKNRILWLVIPKWIAFKYIRDPLYIQEIKQLIKDKKVINSLFLKGDYKPKRLFYLFKGWLGQFLKYQKYYPAD